jgi:hypothetical protein
MAPMRPVDPLQKRVLFGTGRTSILTRAFLARRCDLGISLRTPIGVPGGLRVERQLPGLKKLPTVDSVIAQSIESEPVVRLREVLHQSLKTWCGGFAISS